MLKTVLIFGCVSFKLLSVVFRSTVKLNTCIVYVNFIKIQNTNSLKQNIKHITIVFDCNNSVIFCLVKKHTCIFMHGICLHYNLKICEFENVVLLWMFYSLFFLLNKNSQIIVDNFVVSQPSCGRSHSWHDFLTYLIQLNILMWNRVCFDFGKQKLTQLHSSVSTVLTSKASYCL